MAAPVSLNSIARRARRWADAQSAEPLPPDAVPGADEGERRRLAALGGIAASLAGELAHEWPPALRAWAADASTPPDGLMAEIRSSIDQGQDPLAEIYTRAVRPQNRRRLGTYFTPPVLVEHMLELTQCDLGRDPDVMVDPGAGVGAFTAAAARRWSAARIVAVDVNVVTLGLLAARLAADGLSDRVELVHDDYLRWIAQAARNTDDTWAYVGNPPYTRSQSLDNDAKTTALAATKGLVTSRHATLSTYFAAVTFGHLRQQDAACLLLPAAWTHTRSARELRDSLWTAQRRSLQLHRWPSASRAFTGADVTATVLTIGHDRGRSQPYRYGRAWVVGDHVLLSDEQEKARDGTCPDPMPGGSGRRVAFPPAGTVPLAEVYRVRRGVATGANRFFFLDGATARGLPDRALRPGILSLRDTGITGEVLDAEALAAVGERGGRCALLTITPELAEHPDVAAYLRSGTEQELDKRHLCAQRKPWYALESMVAPDLLLAPLLRSTLQLVRNDVGALPSNAVYGLYLQDGVPSECGKGVAEWLRSPAGLQAVRGHGRRLRGSSVKLEPGDVRTLPIPAALLEPVIQERPRQRTGPRQPALS